MGPRPSLVVWGNKGLEPSLGCRSNWCKQGKWAATGKGAARGSLALGRIIREVGVSEGWGGVQPWDKQEEVGRGNPASGLGLTSRNRRNRGSASGGGPPGVTWWGGWRCSGRGGAPVRSLLGDVTARAGVC